jgi:hypothetical protein
MVYLCFLYDTIKSYYFSLSSLNLLIVVMETKPVFSEVRTESLKLRIQVDRGAGAA